jgi:small GTP-binding protein
MDRKRSEYISLRRTKARKNSADFNLKFDADYDYLMKLVIIGDSSVGKSVIMRRYTDGDYPAEPYISTIGVDFSVKRIEIDNSDSQIKTNMCNNSQKKKNKGKTSSNPFKVKLQVWDTAGQERFRSITQSYYRGMKLCILCFDAMSGNSGSINNITRWLDDIKKHAGEDTYVYVVGTKIDSHDILYYHNWDNLELTTDAVESYEGLNVRFLGWCSSKYDVFIQNPADMKHIISSPGSARGTWSADMVRDNPELSGTTVPNISDMFEEIVFDYLHKASDLSNHVRIQLYDYDEIDMDYNQKQSCCIIL